jgi:hypothetical protein
MCESTSAIFSTDDGSNNGLVKRFSTANTHPSAVCIPIAVEPNLIASIAYSTYYINIIRKRNDYISRKFYDDGDGFFE